MSKLAAAFLSKPLLLFIKLSILSNTFPAFIFLLEYNCSTILCVYASETSARVSTSLDLVDKYNPAASDPNAKNLRTPDKAFAFPEGHATYSAALDNPAAILSAVASSTKVYKSAKEEPISGAA